MDVFLIATAVLACLALLICAYNWGERIDKLTDENKKLYSENVKLQREFSEYRAEEQNAANELAETISNLQESISYQSDRLTAYKTANGALLRQASEASRERDYYRTLAKQRQNQADARKSAIDTLLTKNEALDKLVDELSDKVAELTKPTPSKKRPRPTLVSKRSAIKRK